MRAWLYLLLAGAVFASDPVQDKNFFLLSAIEGDSAIRAAVKSDAVLARMAAERLAAAAQAAANCKLDLACNVAAFQWSDAQITQGAGAMRELYKSSAAVRGFTDGKLRESKMYIRHDKLGGAERLAAAWTECMRGINRMVEIYGSGKAPKYQLIDAMTYDPKTPAYQRVVQSLVAVILDDTSKLELAHSSSLRFALELLWLNHRDEAGRFEPMESGANAAAVRRIKTTDWSRYPYSVIVVPGSGNDRAGVRHSPSGKLRDEIAAMRYRDGKAPFILVSGGYVHPNQTEYCEALEMKRDLMGRFGVPEEAIIIDPHARHTTTNMRNAARLMYRYGIPFEKKALVSTDLSQSEYIEGATFSKRCIEELEYVPYTLLGRVSAFDLEFRPVMESLHMDPADPLDP